LTHGSINASELLVSVFNAIAMLEIERKIWSKLGIWQGQLQQGTLISSSQALETDPVVNRPDV